VLRLVEKIEVVPDAAMDARGHSSAAMRVWTTDSRELLRQADAGPGFPQRPLSREEHLWRFQDCMQFTAMPLPADTVARLLDSVTHLERLADIRELIQLLV